MEPPVTKSWAASTKQDGRRRCIGQSVNAAATLRSPAARWLTAVSRASRSLNPIWIAYALGALPEAIALQDWPMLATVCAIALASPAARPLSEFIKQWLGTVDAAPGSYPFTQRSWGRRRALLRNSAPCTWNRGAALHTLAPESIHARGTSTATLRFFYCPKPDRICPFARSPLRQAFLSETLESGLTTVRIDNLTLQASLFSTGLHCGVGRALYGWTDLAP